MNRAAKASDKFWGKWPGDKAGNTMLKEGTLQR